ncbi:hypothetical protein GCM10010503_23010 [Streptomyces lucensis JCM 4490]|uniref:Uncharacterized protein n=1 Tax=Streptomyces lucensis JCM 4490 TaxID=1306176 RepID=A0A918J506_9ACTN|nr:hypothetical protein [Streptomyces lucensis]GGW45836.1 hypothetical protein GCM10010503_23010 [Streptomyces lucensis JCM 4490]
MSDVTAQASEKTPLPYAETGWSKARRRRGRGLRTCLPAVLDRTSAAQGQGPGGEDNIVRGED